MLAAARRIFRFAAMFMVVTGAFGQAWTKLERVELYGNDYVRLEGWADLYNFKCARKGDEVVATSKWSRLVFTINSRLVEINGVAVHLSVPIARRGEEVFISPLDLRTTVQPILYPVAGAQSRVRTICVDPGHGGKDPGNQEGKQQEKKYALLLAQEVQKQLREAGFKTVQTRSTDWYVDPMDRPGMARKQKADLLVSLHFNSAAETSAQGVETYCLTPAFASSTNARGEGANTGAYDANKNDARNVLLAWHTQKALIKNLGAADRGVRRARFAVLKLCAVPAILVEGGYMSNSAEMKNLADAGYRKKMAKGIVDGIKAYKKAIEAQ